MKKISIIIPIYNVEKYLPACIESIINQSYQNLEIILVNDGSTDACPQICDYYAVKDNRIKVLHKQNGGSSEARNKGIRLVTGDFVGFVDSDDLISIDFYTTLLNLLVENDADIVECGFHEFKNFEDLDDIKIHENLLSEIYDTETAMKASMEGSLSIVIWNKLYKKELLQDISFPIGKYIDDVFWTYKVFGKSKKTVKIQDKLYFYRQQSGSIMRSEFSLRRLDALLGLEEKIDYMKENFPRLENLAIKNFCFISINHYHQILIHNKIDPEHIFRKKIYSKIKKFNKFKIFKNWNWKDIVWFQFFIFTPKYCLRLKEYIEIRAINRLRRQNHE